MLSSCNLDWAYGSGELHMRLYIVGMRGLFDPKRVKWSQLLADAKCIGKVPALIGIEHESARVANEFAEHGCAAQIPAFVLGTDLQLKCGETLVECTLRQ